MPQRTALVQLGKLVAKSIADNGSVTDEMSEMGNALAAHPDVLLELFDLVAKESSKKKANNALIEAFAFMIGQTLDVLRFAVERNYPEAIATVAAARAKALSLANNDRLEPGTLLLMLRQFVTAKLDLGEALQDVMAVLVKHQSVAAMPDRAAMDRFLADLAQNYAGDIFAFQAHLADDVSAFPESHRAGIAAAVLAASDPALREAAVGWLLDPGATTRRDTARLLHEAAGAGHVSGTMLRRMIMLRNWVPEEDRPALDAAIRACRQKGVECAASKTTQVKDVVASGLDGSGAQTIFMLVKDGRKQAMASLLLKQGIGVRDAWVRRNLTKSEAEMFLYRVESELDIYDSTADFVRQALGHFLATNGKSGVLPPFALVDFVEQAGLDTINPESVPVEVLVAGLIEEIPAKRLSDAAVIQSIRDSAVWEVEFSFVDTWFEDDGAIDSLLVGKRLSTKRRAALVLEQYLPTRRQRWAETLAWTALTLKHDDAMQDSWMDLAIVARELLGDRPLAEIPLTKSIAAKTVEAWTFRSH